MLVSPDLARVGPLRQAVRDLHCADEAAVVGRLIEEARMPPDARERIAARATSLVEEVRRERLGQGGLDAFLHEFELSSREGVVLMCLAEALLRVPDAETVDKLIADKIAEADWEAHLGRSDSLFVNASTWALMLTGRVISVDERAERDLGQMLKNLVRKSGEPVIRTAVTQAMPLFLRHAGRGGAHHGRCRALLRLLPGCHQGDRQGGGGPRANRLSGHFGQALGPAPAL
jgi:RHH-type proline utilization regulon transcriptional repressor/proline dehydrogenase/delta 1-pyrroline-5-carboxylate dehydrogenase